MARTRTKFLATVIGLHLSLIAKAEGAGAIEESAPTIIGVLDFATAKGAGLEVAGTMTTLLVKEIESLGEVKVVGEAELRKLLTAHKQDSLVNFDWKCPAEGYRETLGDREPAVRWVVAGKVSTFGKLYILSLRLFDLKSRLVAGRVIRRIRGGPEKLPEEISDATQMLFEEAADSVGLTIVVKSVTTAARHRQKIEESPSAVTVITREDIETSGANSVPNLLRLVPGMDVIMSSGVFQVITSRLNWTFEGNLHLVLIDGREINFDPMGFPVWVAEPIFLTDIERIEIIRGPASALYGANAFTGVVNITTRAIPDRTSAEVLMNMGEAGRTMAGVRGSAKLGEWGFALSGGMDASVDFDDPRQIDKRIWKLRAFVERRWSESKRLLIDAGMSSGDGLFTASLGTVQGEFAPISVRLAYESEDLRGQLYWAYASGTFQIDTPIEYAGMRLATFVPAPMHAHVVDSQLQWTPPVFWEPLRLIVGGGARASWMGSDYLLDAKTYADPNSSSYHDPGISHWEVRSGAFVHTEFALADWITVTGGTRIDYDTQTEWFISPRVAAVLRPATDHYLRMAVARSFRKPSFFETVIHLMAEFPDGSPIQGDAQYTFQELLTRVNSNADLDNEELLVFEAGYAGKFLEGRLTLSLDLYYNQYRNQIYLIPDIVEGEFGLPDLEESSIAAQNEGPDMDIIGGELSVRFSPSRNLSFLASWAHRQVYDYSVGRFSGETPKNLFTLGGRFRTSSGLLGSLYAFARSEFKDLWVENPEGFLQPLQHTYMDNVFLLMGRLGWQFEQGQHFKLETGIKLFLPVSPFSAPHFRYYEAGGGVAPSGQRYGAEQLGRVLTGYLEGSF